MTHDPSAPRTALVIGATGSFGLHAAEALIKHGWRVRALARDRYSVGAGWLHDDLVE